jgi:hypothetical protein
LNYLPEGDRFNAAYFVEQIRSKFGLFPDLQFAKSRKKGFTIHLDNYPDLAPSDFFLFGYLNERMIGFDFGSPENLLEWIQPTFDSITKPVL